MAWLEPISTAVTAASLANELAKASGRLTRYWSRIRNRILKGELIIPVFGAGGVGKSTLAKVLASDLGPFDTLGSYDESWTIERIELTGDIPGRILVAPGQLARVERHWPDLLKVVADRGSKGLINVVAYGYHSLDTESYKEHKLYRKGMGKEQFFKAYSSSRRETEVDLLKNLFASTVKSTGAFWMLTVVNKQDLWWKDRQDVKAFYCEGEYGHVVNSMAEELGPQRFQHEFLPVSMAITSLKNRNGEILAENASGYGQEQYLLSLELLFRRVFELALGSEE